MATKSARSTKTAEITTNETSQIFNRQVNAGGQQKPRVFTRRSPRPPRFNCAFQVDSTATGEFSAELACAAGGFDRRRGTACDWAAPEALWPARGPVLTEAKNLVPADFPDSFSNSPHQFRRLSRVRESKPPDIADIVWVIGQRRGEAMYSDERPMSQRTVIHETAMHLGMKLRVGETKYPLAP